MIVALPNAFATGAKLNTPPAEIDGPLAKSDGLLFETTLNVSVWPDSSAGPALMPVAQFAEYEPESSSTVTSPPPVKDGASLTATIVIVNVYVVDVSLPPFAVPPSSCR